MMPWKEIRKFSIIQNVMFKSVTHIWKFATRRSFIHSFLACTSNRA